MKVIVSGSDKLVLRMSGKLNESADLETVRIPQASSVEIDLIGLTMINSMGIRYFRDWVLGIKAPRLLFSYCPRFFIDQVNMIMDFLPKHARIMSFYVPYFSEDTGESKSVLFNRGEHFDFDNNKVIIKWPAVVDSAGKVMEVDVIGDRYFGFLKKY